ncbi:hypothetical protein BDV34DRAFT_58746 [Aspergillus parasiticus]|uniref:VASt domain-containing protein n=1 Tax=Aspergillus parasiticus TaxID=5067 RepID=A0A5N6DU96_ASPPA|nr:hypothetical protein BDV34DRAFT_58746 [Aspergillus parasiticus]
MVAEQHVRFVTTATKPGKSRSFPANAVPTKSCLTTSLENKNRQRQGNRIQNDDSQQHSREKSASKTSSPVNVRGANSITLNQLDEMSHLTGLTAANTKRNVDFHRLFRNIPDKDMLAEDYGCALQREIIRAGRVYVSDRHICFCSNILGWTATLVISFAEVVAIEKESTAFIFPNAIAIQTPHDRHVFRSLLNRDATFELLSNIWKTNTPALQSMMKGTAIAPRQRGTAKMVEARVTQSKGKNTKLKTIGANMYVAIGDGNTHNLNGLALTKPQDSQTPTTRSVCNMPTSILNPSDSEGFAYPLIYGPTVRDEFGQYETVVSSGIIPAPLDVFYSLTYGASSGNLIRNLIVKHRKFMKLRFETQRVSLSDDNRSRKYSYSKPTTGFFGPHIKCISTEYLDFLDLDRAIVTTVTTDTLGSPKGVIPRVRTRYLATRGPRNETLLRVSCSLEWRGRTWLKSLIEKHCLDAQAVMGNEVLRYISAKVMPRDSVDFTSQHGGEKRAPRGKNLISPQRTADAVTLQQQSWSPYRNNPLLLRYKNLSFYVAVAVAIVAIVATLLFSVQGFPVLRATLFHSDAPADTCYQDLLSCLGTWKKEHRKFKHESGLGERTLPVFNVPDISQTCQKWLQSLHEEGDVRTLSDEELDKAIETERTRLSILKHSLEKQKLQVKNDGKRRHPWRR